MRPEAATGKSALIADFLASLVVFMVALPLCIGIAQACGLPPEAGRRDRRRRRASWSG